MSCDIEFTDFDIVNVIVRRSEILFQFNCSLKTAELVGSVFYGRNFTVFGNGFVLDRLVFVGMSWPLGSQVTYEEPVPTYQLVGSMY